jgi:hypothetical protein
MLGRLRQVLYYMRPRLDGLEAALAGLNPAQQALFLAMAPQDQAHALRVAARLAQAPPHVREAALLHDCGKPREFRLWGRILGVLLPLKVDELPAATGWRRQLQIYQWHDAWGLRAAVAAGTSPEAIELLRAYHTRQEPQPAWLGSLKSADDLG